VDGTEMTVLQINENPDGTKRCVGTIAMVTRDWVAAPTAISMMMTDLSFLGPDEFVQRFIVQGNVLVFQRNECIHKMDGDWILFIDSDMAYQPGMVKTLVETREKFDLDIVGGLCFQRAAPYQPTMYMRAADESHGYTFLEEWDEDAAVEVDATGMAFCLIHKRVLSRIMGGDYPDLATRADLTPWPFFSWGGEYGEDFKFCMEAKATGSRIFVDTAVKVDHLGMTAINEESFLREIAFRNDQQQAFREWQLDTIGQKAISRERAKERLGVTW
jgi:glycosyltransferase involved in cell wall biosynthesis